MSTSLSLVNRSFNIRISFDANGQPVIGFVQSLYNQSENVTEILEVPSHRVAQIAASLGITKAQDFGVQALIRKNLQGIENNPKINSAVSC